MVNDIQKHKVEQLSDDDLEPHENINYNNIEIDYNDADPDESKVKYKTLNKSNLNVAKITIRFI